jgi:cytochrome b subunit of formate dehydrogenase
LTSYDRRRLIRKIIQWLLLAVAVVLLITGLGITEYQIVETASFGLLTKSISHQIHTAPGLWIFFLILLAAHISLSLVWRKKN